MARFDLAGTGRAPGAVRIRSNVCMSPRAGSLVPGEIADRYLRREFLTDKQREEKSYYDPCSRCKRTAFQIQEQGCDHPNCRKQGIPVTEEMKRRRQP